MCYFTGANNYSRQLLQAQMLTKRRPYRSCLISHFPPEPDTTVSIKPQLRGLIPICWWLLRLYLVTLHIGMKKLEVGTYKHFAQSSWSMRVIRIWWISSAW